MKLRHVAMALGGLTLLGACSSNPTYDTAYFWHAAGPSPACTAKQAEMRKSADFAKPTVIDITVKDGIYTPATLTLMHGQPYLLRYHNDDAQSHSVTSPDFFADSAVGTITLDGKGAAPAGCIARIILAPKKSTFAQIMPAKEGRYSWTDSYGPDGFVWLQRRDIGDVIVH